MVDERAKGRLKIFLGMAAGVGKTYTMLEAAQKKIKEGVDVLVGNVETHGREDTARLLQPLKQISAKTIIYKEKSFKELDADEIIRRKPQLVIVDELAHSNIPGSKHLKRWQDVVEILEAGIDVFTTINIQHIESYKDIVEEIVGIKIWETVPDHVVEQASDIELVDIPPAELLQRLREGKVYTGGMSEIALKNFFQEERLTALRELALRFTAEMVDIELNEMVSTMRKGKVWRQRERLLVAINHYPYMLPLIRSARRLAATLHAPWVALHVDDGTSLSDEESASLSKNLALARELGAEVTTTQDSEIWEGIRRIVQQKNITQVIIGKRIHWRWKTLFVRSLAEKISKTCNVDVHIIRPSAYFPIKKKLKKKSNFQALWPYFHIFCWAILISFINFILIHFVDYRVVGTLFLLSILLLGLFYRRGPLLFCSLLYIFIWAYFFAPKITSPQDIALGILFLLAALITGTLTNRVKRRQELLRKRERSTQAIYEIVREISTASTSGRLFQAVKMKLGSILNGSCEIIPKSAEDGLKYEPDSQVAHQQKEAAVAQWVFEHGQEAGWSTSTLPSVEYLYLPLKSYKEIVGVLAFRPYTGKLLLPEERNFLYTVAQQLANFLARSLVEAEERKNQLHRQMEEIYSRVVQSLSVELSRPLKAIQEALIQCEGVEKMIKEPRILSAHLKIQQTSESLMRITESTTSMAKLSGDVVAFKKELNDMRGLIQNSSQEMNFGNHRLLLNLADNIPPFPFDYSLMKILLQNLLSNAIQYSPPGTTIEVDATLDDTTFILAILDEGQGIPEDKLDRVFEKFYRVKGTSTTGLGLGLAIVKSIAEIHNGWITVQNRSTGGSKFSLIIPL